MSYEFLVHSGRHHPSDSSPASSYRRLPLFHHQKASASQKSEINFNYLHRCNFRFHRHNFKRRCIFSRHGIFFLWFLNFPILITTRNKPLIREGFVNFFLWSLASCFCTFLFILILVVCGISTASVIVGVFLIFPLWFFLKNRINDWTEEVFFTNRSHDKNKDETDFENKWQGKLDRERFEKDKDGR